MTFSFAHFISTAVRLTLLCTPFFVLSVFFSITGELTLNEKRILARRTATAVLMAAIVIYLFGGLLFQYLGITLNAFRIGAGLVLMLSGIELVRTTGVPKGRDVGGDNDVSVVPLAIPVTLGPGTIGALLEMGAKEGVNLSTRINDCLAIAVASAILFSVLFFADSLAKLLKGKGIVIVTKLTGMYLVALAAEIIFTGIKGFLHI
ncbi:MAG: MarC family protein [Lentisphaeria bacterium]|nr:MarC family protein [Lentisphaeria bacterium]MBR7119487.1 MarC family protein [Lentisphaeria bacterium]